MRKGDDGGNGGEKRENKDFLLATNVVASTARTPTARAKKKITAEIVATTSLPVDCLTATDCNAAASAKKGPPC